MALRIDRAIIRGWIDNTKPGVTRGGLELVGMSRPVQMILRGNCWRDLAGTRLDFTNPHPEAQEEEVSVLQGLQRGVVGDMTASKRVRVAHIKLEELDDYIESQKEVPFDWHNCLYLEWFSLVNGRVVIETTDFELKLSTHKWELDEEGEIKQRVENTVAIEHFQEIMHHAVEAESQVNDEITGEADEFEWEKRLRIRDSLEEAAMFLGEAKMEEISVEDHLEESVKGRHALVKHAHKVQTDVLLYLGNSFLDDGARGELAMALGYVLDSLNEAWPEKDIEMENGYRIAILKRAMEACNVAVSSCNTLEMEDDGYRLLREDIFKLRDHMIDETHALRDGNDDQE